MQLKISRVGGVSKTSRADIIFLKENLAFLQMLDF